MKTEKLHIKNFGGLEELDIELVQINVLIGPQATGKSICAKMCYFFKEIVATLVFQIVKESTQEEIKQTYEAIFLKYFPSSTWGKKSFQIRYSCGQLWITVRRTTRNSSTVSLSYSRYFGNLIDEGLEAVKRAKATPTIGPQKEKDAYRISLNEAYDVINGKLDQEIGTIVTNWNTFVPAGRSFFETIQNVIFSIIAQDGTIDPFIAEFGRSYKRITQELKEKRGGKSSNSVIEEYVSKLIGGTYLHIEGDEFIVMGDGRHIPIEYASSGQQEALALAMTLVGIAESEESKWCTMIIEEPEAHLHPTAQRDIVHLIALVAGIESIAFGSQYFITTHSPYILSALNNLMYGGKLSKETPAKEPQVSKLLGGVFIDPARVHAYALGNGTAHSIIDTKTGLVNAEALDKVSGELAHEFEALVDIEFEEQPA